MNIKSYSEELCDVVASGGYTGYLSGLPSNKYHGLRCAYSSTNLKFIHSHSPLHFKHNVLDSCVESEPSKDMLMGLLVHSLLLEPAQFNLEFYEMPQVDRRTKAGKELYESSLQAAGGKTLVTEGELITARNIVTAILGDNKSVKLLERAQHKELSYFWKCPFSGLKFRARADGVSPSFLLEVKTSRSAEPSAFERLAFNLGYALQAAHYREGLRVIENDFGTSDSFEGYFIVVENEPPFVVQTYKMSDEFLEVGHSQWVNAVMKLEAGVELGKWPGYDAGSGEALLLGVPKWALKREYNWEEVSGGI